MHCVYCPCCLKGVTQFLPAVTNRVDITKGEDGELVKGEESMGYVVESHQYHIVGHS